MGHWVALGVSNTNDKRFFFWECGRSVYMSQTACRVTQCLWVCVATDIKYFNSFDNKYIWGACICLLFEFGVLKSTANTWFTCKFAQATLSFFILPQPSNNLTKGYFTQITVFNESLLKWMFSYKWKLYLLKFHQRQKTLPDFWAVYSEQ